MEGIYIVFIFIIGLVVGSFLNVCITRLPKEKSIIYPASSCLNCGFKLKKYDLIPIFSFLLLKGKCRNCNSKISKVYPIVELITGLIFIALYIKFGFTTKMYLYSLLMCVLIVSSLIDINTNYVYFVLSLLGISFGIIFVLYNYLNEGIAFYYLLGGIVSGLIILIFALLGIMGFGDIEIAFICGLFLGLQSSILMNILAVLFGGIAGSIIILTKNKKERVKTMPFVPFIALGCLMSLLYGEKIINSFIIYYGFY